MGNLSRVSHLDGPSAALEDCRTKLCFLIPTQLLFQLHFIHLTITRLVSHLSNISRGAAGMRSEYLGSVGFEGMEWVELSLAGGSRA